LSAAGTDVFYGLSNLTCMHGVGPMVQTVGVVAAVTFEWKEVQLFAVGERAVYANA